jgi:G-protein coupled receptor 98
VRTEGTLVFEPGQKSAVLDVVLTPETGSLNKFPKRFQIVLFDPKGGARIDKVYGTANITLISDADSQAVWGLEDLLHQPLHEDILNRVLHNLNLRVATESTDEQLSAVMLIMEKVGHPLEHISVGRSGSPNQNRYLIGYNACYYEVRTKCNF